MKNAVINARIESQLKGDVEAILRNLGLSATQAITIFYQQIKLNNGIPFEIKIPNEETAQAIQDAREGKNMTKISLEELKKEVSA